MDSIRSTQSFTVQRSAGQVSSSELPPQERDPNGDQSEGRGRDSYDETLAAAEELTTDEELAEGDRHDQELLEKYGLWEDEDSQNILWRLFEQLEPRMSRPEVAYDFACLATDIPFASSCPNGSIYFSRGLLHRLREQELLFFAAHELAHTELRHYATRHRRLSDLRLSIPAAPGSPARLRLDQAAVLTVRHQEEFEADFQAAQWLSPDAAGGALKRLHQVCLAEFPASLQRPTHPPFEKRLHHLQQGLPFPAPLDYLYGLVG